MKLQWISVNDRLPAKDINVSSYSVGVLVHDDSDNIGVAYLYYEDSTWYDNMTGSELSDITIEKWCYLPIIADVENPRVKAVIDTAVPEGYVGL